MGVKQSADNGRATGGKSQAQRGAVQVTQHDRAVLELKLQRDKLNSYQKRMDLLMDKETAAAREFLSRGQKDKALFCLRRKKCHGLQLERSRALLENVHKLITDIEFVKVEKAVFDSLREGTKTLQAMNKELSLETVEQVMEDAAEAIQHQHEVSELLGGYLGEDHETEALEELSALELASMKVPDAVVPVAERPVGTQLDAVRVPSGPVETEEPVEADGDSRKVLA